MFSAGVFSLLVFLLAGCSAKQPTWIRPAPLTEEQARFDQQVCGHAAGNMLAPVPSRFANPFPSIGLEQAPVANQMAAFDSCMESKGYRRP